MVVKVRACLGRLVLTPNNQLVDVLADTPAARATCLLLLDALNTAATWNRDGTHTPMCRDRLTEAYALRRPLHSDVGGVVEVAASR